MLGMIGYSTGFNLVTIVPVDFQQKTNLALNDCLDPPIILVFSACTWYAKCCLFCIVYEFCVGDKIDCGNPIESNKYINQ